MGRRVDPSWSLSYYLFQQVFHDWSNKDRSMCYPVCGMVNITYPLLLNEKITHLVAVVGFLFHYVNGPLPYVRRHITVNKMCRVRR